MINPQIDDVAAVLAVVPGTGSTDNMVKIGTRGASYLKPHISVEKKKPLSSALQALSARSHIHAYRAR